jgi:putative ABC transport system permease protein
MTMRPDWKSEIRRRLAKLQLEPTREAAILEELAQHLADCYAELLASGATAAEAERQTLLELSESELLMRELRRVERPSNPEPIVLGTNRRTNMLADLWQDLRFGVQMLRKNPGFTFIAVLMLALGIGANTTMFSVVNAVWLRSLPYPEAEQLMLVWHRNKKQGDDALLTSGNYLDLLRQNQSFARMAAISDHDFSLTGRGEPERLQGQSVSAALFQLLKVAPVIGRDFTETDDQVGATRVVILSHGLWQRRFGGQADVIGQTLTLNDLPYTVVGVMPPGFTVPEGNAELWTPIAFSAEAANDRGSFYLSALARLKPGVTLEQAQSEADVIAHNLEQAYPKSNTDLGFSVVSLHGFMVRGFKQSLWVLLGAVAFTLLIACVNVANLLLARAAVREKELAVRTALGAARWRLVRQLLTESMLLAFGGGALGTLLALWGIQALKLISPTGPNAIARLDEINLDWRVLGFTFGIACLTGIIFGLAPALQLSRPDLQHTLKEGGRGSSSATGQRLREILVVAEVALSLVLLIGAGLLIRSFIRLQNVDPGFKPERLLTMNVILSQDKARDLASISNFYQQVIERVQSLPGVEAASVATVAPIVTAGRRSPIVPEDKPDPPPGVFQVANNRVVSPDYFRTLGVPLQQGRLLSAQDHAQAPGVVVINQALARHYWGDENPLGKRLKIGARTSKAPWLTVVGIVGDVRQAGLNSEALPEFYTPFTQEHQRFVRPRVLFVRTTGDPLSLITAVKSQIWSVDKDQPINDVRTMEEIVTQWLAPRRFNLLLLGAFAALALVLASVGIYGVISYAVSQRTREIGVRLALGAQARDILKLIVGQGMVLTLGGVTIGLIASFVLTRWLESLLFSVSATDPLTFILIPVLLIAVALLACWLPARRATKVDPMAALRSE